jgi:hypothetical protein
LQKFADLRVPGIVLAPLILLAACTEARAPAATSPPAEDSAVQGGLLPAAPVAQPCGKHGSLETTVFGALAGDIRWYGSEMSCEGMPRPEGAGARLRFAGTAGADALDLAIIIALPELAPTATARELPSKLTLIEEGRGRFFSSGEQPNCWTDVARQEPLADGDGEFVIAGTLFCIGPLAEVNGDASVTIEELQFSGSLDWNTQ